MLPYRHCSTRPAPTLWPAAPSQPCQVLPHLRCTPFLTVMQHVHAMRAAMRLCVCGCRSSFLLKSAQLLACTVSEQLTPQVVRLMSNLRAIHLSWIGAENTPQVFSFYVGTSHQEVSALKYLALTWYRRKDWAESSGQARGARVGLPGRHLVGGGRWPARQRRPQLRDGREVSRHHLSFDLHTWQCPQSAIAPSALQSTRMALCMVCNCSTAAPEVLLHTEVRATPACMNLHACRKFSMLPFSAHTHAGFACQAGHVCMSQYYSSAWSMWEQMMGSQQQLACNVHVVSAVLVAGAGRSS